MLIKDFKIYSLCIRQQYKIFYSSMVPSPVYEFIQNLRVIKILKPYYDYKKKKYTHRIGVC
jgi:uncharacterized membrane protein